jgi:hypothetical protein
VRLHRPCAYVCLGPQACRCSCLARAARTLQRPRGPRVRPPRFVARAAAKTSRPSSPPSDRAASPPTQNGSVRAVACRQTRGQPLDSRSLAHPSLAPFCWSSFFLPLSVSFFLPAASSQLHNLLLGLEDVRSCIAAWRLRRERQRAQLFNKTLAQSELNAEHAQVYNLEDGTPCGTRHAGAPCRQARSHALCQRCHCASLLRSLPHTAP